MITIPYLTAVSTYFSYVLLFAFGQLCDYSRLLFDWWRTNNLQGYAPICLAHEDFYIRRLYHRIQVSSPIAVLSHQLSAGLRNSVSCVSITIAYLEKSQGL